MKLIIVNRSRPEVYERLRRAFADDVNVEVIRERRMGPIRKTPGARVPERRLHDRRRFAKPWSGRGYIVIYIAERKAS